MWTPRRLVIAPLLAVLGLSACAGGGRAWGIRDPAAALARAHATSVFGPAADFDGSDLPDVGTTGLFPVHPEEACEVGVLAGGEDSYAMRLALLRGATRSIRVQALIFTADEAGLRIAELLIARRREGLDVHVIVDALSNVSWQTQWMYFDLMQHGVDVEGYEAAGLQWLNELSPGTPHGTLRQADQRFHEKLWILDGETDHGVAVTGGLNLANEYFRVDPSHVERYWRDQDVVVRGAVVADLTRAFDRNVTYFQAIKASRGWFDTRRYWGALRAALARTGHPSIAFTASPRRVALAAALEARVPQVTTAPARCRFFQSRPRLHESYIQQAYLKLVAGARREVVLANAYFVPTPAMRAALVDAARRCVHVTVLTNSAETNDTPGLSTVGRAYYAGLLATNTRPDVRACAQPAGIEIWEWRGQRADEARPSQGLMHAKYVVVDGETALVGSHNLDPRSERLNSESALAFASPGLAQALVAGFTRDLASSRKISLGEARGFARPPGTLARLKLRLGKVFEDEL
ncbi:MAG: phosphatidylserine/phosphatidylglycerophosphate/cardiolipin synthase family protein [Kofleriaceae bacterium]